MTHNIAGSVGGWLRVLGLLLIILEPFSFAVAAVGVFNAIGVRGAPVVLVLAARLATAALCVAAGRALLDRRPSGPGLAKVALLSSAVVQVFADLTPYFPSNRPPGQMHLLVWVTIVYYGAWFGYLARSKRVARTFA